MAEYIDGNSGAAQFAPLSHAQTVAISRHLQEQITVLQGRLDDVLREVRQSNEDITGLRSHKDDHNDVIGDLREDLAGTKTNLETTRQNLSRTNGIVQTLTTGLEKAAEDIVQLKNEQKLMRTNFERVDQDLQGNCHLAVQLQEVIEKRLNLDVDKLRADLNRTNLELQRLREDEEGVKVTVSTEREALRQLLVTTKNMTSDMANEKTKAEISDNRLSETIAGLKAAVARIDELASHQTGLHEEHSNTLFSHQELMTLVKKVRAQLKNVDEHSQRVGASLGDTQQRLEFTTESVSELAAKLQAVQGECLNTTQGHAMLKSKVHQLHSDLANVASTTEKVKAGLKETSSILLPNISMDSEVSTRTAHHGSILHTSPLISGKSPKTPRNPNGKSSSGGGGSSQQNAWT
eukprot:TRINITY_DN29351_c0_g1_i1.p1 TRINITY_DN29351_c0_g1~~TRINITY_DN29351_c0_g1_i1.p1  ORF type:complete len:426 (+),score=80.47 TRINITY_DN29351_c0_g1_i1:62-1279(+)